MKKIKIIYIFLLLFSATAFANEKDLPRRDSLIYGTLPNGLKYYIYPHSYPKGEAVYRLFVKSGSLNETESQRGLAHFIEHLAFNGTEHFPGNQLVRYLERNGGKFGKDLNAHTSFGETVFKLQMPSSDRSKVDTTMTILSDWAKGILFDSLEVEKERGVILSERLQRQSPEQKSNETFINEIFNGSRYSQRITIGDTTVIRNSNASDLKDYYGSWYRPGLMAVAVVGDIDPAYIKAQIEDKFGTMPVKNKPANVRYVIPEYRTNKYTVYYDKALKDATLDILYLGKAVNPITKASEYYQYILGGLINRLLRQRFNNISFHNPDYKDASINRGDLVNAASLTDASVTLEKGKAKDGISQFIKESDQILNYGFTRLEIDQAKRSLYRIFRNRLSSTGSITSSNLMDEIYNDYYSGNRFISDSLEFVLMQNSLAKIDSITIIKTLKKSTLSNKYHVLLRAPESFQTEIGTSESLESIFIQAKKAPLKRYGLNFKVPDQLCSEPKGGKIVSSKEIPALKAIDWRLDNGVRVIFKQSSVEKDRISISGFRKGGLYSLDSLDYVNGLFAGSIVPISGAGDFSREALNYYLADNSASVRFLVDKTRTGIFASSIDEDANDMFKLLYLKWTEPRINQDVFRQVVEKSCDNYRKDKPTPEEEFSKELGYLINGKNYTNEELTDTLIISRTEEAKMLPVFDQLFGNADGYTFIVISDLDESKIRPYVETYLGALPHGATDTTFKFSSRNIPLGDITFERHTGTAKKATVSLIFQNGKRPMENMEMTNLKCDILSSVLRSVLLESLREELGKVYSVSVSSSAGKYPSFLSRTIIAFECSPEDVQTLIEVTNSKLEQIIDNKSIINSYLEQVKANLVKEFKINLQKNTFYTTLIRNSIFNNEENWDFIAEYEDSVNEFSTRDVSEMIKQVISSQRIKAVLYPSGN